MRSSLGENAKMALDTLRENKVRSFLTVLGVVIGITALITVSSILVGFYADVTAYLDRLRPEHDLGFQGRSRRRHRRLTAEERNRKPLTLEDAQAIREQCPAVRGGIGLSNPAHLRHAIARRRSPPATRTSEVNGLNYSGSDVYYPDVYNAHPYIGRYFTEAEDLHRADVAVIGYDLGKTFFPDGRCRWTKPSTSKDFPTA